METHQKCREKIYFVYEGTMESSCSLHLRWKKNPTSDNLNLNQSFTLP